MIVIITVLLPSLLVDHVLYAKEFLEKAPWVSKMLNGKSRLNSVEMLEILIEKDGWELLTATSNAQRMYYTLRSNDYIKRGTIDNGST